MESLNPTPEQNRPEKRAFDAEQFLDIEKMTLGGQEGKAKIAAEAFLLVSKLIAESAGVKKEDDLAN